MGAGQSPEAVDLQSREARIHRCKTCPPLDRLLSQTDRKTLAESVERLGVDIAGNLR